MGMQSAGKVRGFLMISGMLVSLASVAWSAEPQAPDFAREIQPVFAKRCYKCHGPNAAEAGLRLSSREDALKSLESGRSAVVPGNLETSELLKRVRSTDETLRMPPEGKPQLSKEEILQIIHWIDAGAPWAEGTRVEAPKNIESKPVSEPDEPVAGTPAPGEPVKVEPKPAPVARITYIDTKAFEEQDGGILVTELEAGKLAISLSAAHRKDPVSFDLSKALAPYKGKVQRLNIAGAALHPEAWTALAGLEGLVELHAAYTNLGDTELEALSSLSALTQLNLHGTKVSSRGLEKLVVNKNLRRLWVNEIELMNDDVDKLRSAMPDCDIIFK